MPLAGRWQNDRWRGRINIFLPLNSLYLLFCFFWCHWPADDRMTDGEIEFIYLCTYILHTFYFALSDATGRQMTEWHLKVMPVYLHKFHFFHRPAIGRMTLESNVFIFPLVSMLLSFLYWPADDRMTDGEVELIYLCTWILYTFYFALSDVTGRQMTEWHLRVMSLYCH